MTTTAYSYVRFSTARQATGDSLRRQTEQTAKAVEANGWILDTTLNLRDMGVSAFKGLNADEGRLGAFIEAVKSGVVKPGSVLIVECLDRLSRQDALSAANLVSQIIKSGVNVYTTFDSKLYTIESLTNTADILLLILTFIRANEESATKSKRIKAKWTTRREEARTNGMPIPAAAPFWVVKTPTGYAADPIRHADAHRLIELSLAGHGSQIIAQTMNAEGRRSPKGKTRWGHCTVRMLLKSKAFIGTYQPRDTEGREMGEAIPNYYPPVCTEAEFYRVQSIVKSRTHNGTTTGQGRTGEAIANLFTGILRDAGGFNYTVLRGWGNKRIFVSQAAREGMPGGSFASFPHETFERAFLGWISEVQISPTAARSSKVESLETELGMVNERLATLQAALLTAPNIQEIITATKTLADRRDTLQSELENEKARTAAPRVNTKDVADLFEKMAAMPEADRTSIRTQLKQAIGQVVKTATMTVARRRNPGNTYTAAAVVGVEFTNGQSRTFVIRTLEAGKWESLAWPKLASNRQVTITAETVLNAARLVDAMPNADETRTTKAA